MCLGSGSFMIADVELLEREAERQLVAIHAEVSRFSLPEVNGPLIGRKVCQQRSEQDEQERGVQHHGGEASDTSFQKIEDAEGSQ